MSIKENLLIDCGDQRLAFCMSGNPLVTIMVTIKDVYGSKNYFLKIVKPMYMMLGC